MPPAVPTAPLAEASLAAIRTIARWYRETVYGRFEGPGTVPFYCDHERVGPFGVDPAALARGDGDALFRLFVVLAMYQSRRDVDIMRRQRGTPRMATGRGWARLRRHRLIATDLGPEPALQCRSQILSSIRRACIRDAAAVVAPSRRPPAPTSWHCSDPAARGTCGWKA